MAVVYPGQIKTDREKLSACYSLLEQMRLEHSKVAAIARAEPERYIATGKFKVYATKTKSYMKQLLAERNSLMEAIRRASYTTQQWEQISKLSLEEQRSIHLTMYGDRGVEQVKTTKATSSLLDDLKATKLDSLQSRELLPDPTEDFTSANWNSGTPQSNENSRISAVTSSKETITGLTRADTCYHYRDCGANHFDGDFEHLLKTYAGSITGYGIFLSWMVDNDVGDWYALSAGNKSCIFIYWYQAGAGGAKTLTVREIDGASTYTDTSTGLSLATTYFLEVERDDDAGDSGYGLMTVHITTGDYYDNAGTPVDDLSLSLHTSRKDFRYIYSANSRDDASPSSEVFSGWVELLDLQEVIDQPFRNYYPHILAH